MEKTKKQYVSPEITVVEVEPEHILAGSGGLEYNRFHEDNNDIDIWDGEFD